MKLCQWFTPRWVAEALVERHFSRLGSSDLVLDPSCGPGAFLLAVPRDVPAVGVEIDPALADRARRETGRRIVVGDFRDVDLGVNPTALIGNPPFHGATIDAFLDRARRLLPEGGRAGFILPCYALRTAGRVADLLESWSILGEFIPRTAFSYRMREPLMFAVFSRDRRRTLVGFALYEEEADRLGMARPYKELVAKGARWVDVCRLALERLGGEADLAAIYRELERNRPGRSRFWREKIRQTLRLYADQFRAIGEGRYALEAAS